MRGQPCLPSQGLGAPEAQTILEPIYLFYYFDFIYLFLRNATFNMCKIHQYNQNLSGAIRHNSVARLAQRQGQMRLPIKQFPFGRLSIHCSALQFNLPVTQSILTRALSCKLLLSSHKLPCRVARVSQPPFRNPVTLTFNRVPQNYDVTRVMRKYFSLQYFHWICYLSATLISGITDGQTDGHMAAVRNGLSRGRVA